MARSLLSIHIMLGSKNQTTVMCGVLLAGLSAPAEVSTNSVADLGAPAAFEKMPDMEQAGKEQNWNFHVQNTVIVQGYPGFQSDYSGPKSLPDGGETRESVSLDLMAGVRLWKGAEAHVDGLMW